jgi:hypothetical protein
MAHVCTSAKVTGPLDITARFQHAILFDMDRFWVDKHDSLRNRAFDLNIASLVKAVLHEREHFPGRFFRIKAASLGDMGKIKKILGGKTKSRRHRGNLFSCQNTGLVQKERSVRVRLLRIYKKFLKSM